MLKWEGIDYNEVFFPIFKYSFIRILLALVAQMNMKLVQLDVKIAFYMVTWKTKSITRGIQSCWKRRYDFQSEKIDLWFETITKVTSISGLISL